MSRPIAFRETFLIAVSAGLLSLPFHFSFLWPLAFLALVPYFFLLRDKSSGSAAVQSYGVGVFFWALTGYWMNYVNVLGFILLAAYLALYFGAFGLFASRYFSTQENRVRAEGSPKTAFYLSSAWVFLEWVRGWMLSGIPWALLGESQWQNRLYIQMADLTGVWGISFFVLLTNYWIYRVLSGVVEWRKTPKTSSSQDRDYLRGRWMRDGMWLIVLQIMVIGYGALALAKWDAYLVKDDLKPLIRVSVAQGNIPQDQKWNRRVRDIIFEKYKRLTFMCVNEHPDLIVWPETSFPGILDDEPLMAAQLRSAVRHAKVPTLVGAPTLGDLEQGLRFFNTAILFGANGEVVKTYNKIHLVPFGEYIPMEPLMGIIRHFVDIGQFDSGKEKTLFTIRSESSKPFFTAKFAVLICYEDIFPSLVRDFAGRGADFLVNITNDAWFGKTTAPYQHAQGSVFRAVENRMPVIRSTNTGYSCFIDATGRVYAAVEENGEALMVTGHRTADVILKKGRSFYTRFGDVFLWLCFVFLVMAHLESSKPAWAKG